MTLTHGELVALASPPCPECGLPIQRVEMRWHQDGDGTWQAGPYFTICSAGHRTRVEPLP